MNRSVFRSEKRSSGKAAGARAGLLFHLLAAALMLTMIVLMRTSLPAQELDETRQRRVPIAAKLVWDNLTESAQFLRGAKPKYALRWRLSTVRLEPGTSVEFLVPAHELVRVVSCDASRLSADQIQIWTSNGSGLYRRQNAAYASDGLSAIAAPDQSGLSVAKVARPADANCGITIAVFTSRRAIPELLDYYQCPILNCGKPVEISDDRGSKTRAYSYFPAGTSHRMRIEGPIRLRVEARLKYALDVEQRQTYWLQVYIDGVLDRVLSFDTLPQRHNRVFVDGCERLVGRREFAYLDLDCGDQVVEIRSSHAAYLRADAVGLDLCRGKLNRSFAFPSWENVQKAVSNWDAVSLDPNSDELSQAFMDDGQIALRPEEMGLLWNPYLHQQEIQGLARSNQIPHSGLRAYMWMRAIASLHYGDADYGDEINVTDLANRLRERYTFFRDLLPAELDPRHEPRVVAFHNREIRRPNQKRTETIVGEQHISDALGWLPTTTLVRLPAGGEGNLTYQVPESLGNSIVRLIVDQTHLTGPGRMLIQFDDRPPIDMAVMPKDVIKPLCFVPGRPEAALSALASIHPKYDSGTAGGPFALTQRPTPVVRAASIHFFKPANVQRIRVTLDSCVDPEVHIGLQYLDARKVQLSETAYRQLQTVVVNEAPGTSAHRFAAREISNHSLPLERLLQSHHQTFAASVARSEQVNPPVDRWDRQIVDDLQRRADSLASNGQWADAIEKLTQIINHADGDVRRRAVIARADALRGAGEEFLSNRELRGWLRYSPDPQLRYEALHRLLDSADTPLSREQYLAFAAIEQPDRRFEHELATELMNNGRYRFALLLLTSLVADEENEDILLRCSYQAQWWQLFDQTAKRLRDPEKKNLWMGLKECRLGRYAHARRLLKQGGQEGAQWLSHWDSGHHVVTRLASRDGATRLKAIAAWEQWQQNHPGPRKWVDEPAAIKSCSGAITLYSTQRDLRSRMFVADTDSPGEVTIHGPVRIKIEARPMHAGGSQQSINDWLLLTSNTLTRRVPITNNYPSSGLRIEASPAHQVGALVTAEIDLPAGLNRFSVSADNAKIAFRVLAQRPEIATPVLPYINETSLATMIKGDFGRRSHRCDVSDGDCRDCIRMICRDRKCRSVPLSYTATPCGCNELHVALHYFNQLAFGDVQQWQNRFMPTDTDLRIVGYDDVWTAAVDAAHVAESMSDDRSKMQGITHVQQLLSQHPQRDDLQTLLSRLRAGTNWEPYRQYDARAGIHTIEIDRWSPETPEIRIRKSLMNAESAFVLTGSNQLTLQVNEANPTEFQVSMRRPRLGFLPMGKTIAVVDSEAQSQSIELSDPDQLTSIRTQLPPESALEISHGNPLANHFIHVDVQEVASDGFLLPIDGERLRTGAGQRTYQVATQTEPLKFRVAGPTLLRIDRYDDGVVTNQVVAVPDDQNLTLAPSPGQEMSMFRIFELRFAEATPVYHPTVNPPLPQEQPTGQVVQAMFEQIEAASNTNLDLIALLPPDHQPLPIVLRDSDELGLQRLGTWAAELGYRSRIAVEEFPNAATADEFLEWNVSRFHFDQWRDRYSQNDLIIRPRLDSGVTIGLNHRGETSIPLAACKPNARADGWGPVQLDWHGSWYQQIEAQRRLATANDDPWSIGFGGSVSRGHQLHPYLSHRPTVSFFGRELSEDENGYQAGAVDLDVFTQYKSDHRYGFRLSDRWVYQTCLDRRWWIQPSLTTNEDELVPDNLGFRVGTDQLLGPLQFRAAYRLTGYFADNHRQQGSVQNVLYLDLMLERWHAQTRRSELRFSMRSDLESGRSSIGFNLVSFLNHARGYRDFRPSSTLFRSIRKERAAKHYHLHR